VQTVASVLEVLSLSGLSCERLCRHRPVTVPRQVALASARLLPQPAASTGVCNPAHDLVPAGVTPPRAQQRPTTLSSPWPALLPARVDDYAWLRDDSRTDRAVLAHLVRPCTGTQPRSPEHTSLDPSTVHSDLGRPGFWRPAAWQRGTHMNRPSCAPALL